MGTYRQIREKYFQKRYVAFIRDVERAKVSLKAYFASRGAKKGLMPRCLRRGTFIAVAVLLLCLAGSLFFLTHKHGQIKNIVIVKADEPKPIPIPTALDPNFSTQVNECFIPVAAIYGYTLRITSGFRSLAEQGAIYDSGRIVDGHIITWAEPGQSLHNYGFAVDVVDRWRGYNIDFDKLAKIGTYCGLEQVDPPHFEHRAGLTTDDFAAGKRPPPLTLPCPIMDERYKANQPLTLKDLQSCSTPNF